MAILDFQRPDRVIMLEGDERKARFEFRPLEPGYGITIGNALRRILIHSLEGYAISWIRIEGVDHEFSTIPGVIEDVTQIILNLKQVRFKVVDPDKISERVTVSIAGQDQFTAGFIDNFLSGLQILNPELVICNMNPSVRLEMQINIQKGRGYISAEDNAQSDFPFGVIPIDSIHTPIRNVMYKVDNYRVEQKTDYEMLTIEVTTDGSILPTDALKGAAHILIEHFMLFSDGTIDLEKGEATQGEEFTEEEQATRQLLRTKLVDLKLSVRALNCLKAAEVETVGDLVRYSKNDLLKFRNFGRKSLTELEEIVESMGLEFAMDIERFKIDKEF